MNRVLLLALLATLSLSHAENNQTMESNLTTNSEQNSTLSTQEDRVKEQVAEQMRREQKYAQEQRFYQGDEYNLSAVEIDENARDSIPLIEPDYDFEIDDVYRDDL